jgi:hypothetical protein
LQRTTGSGNGGGSGSGGGSENQQGTGTGTIVRDTDTRASTQVSTGTQICTGYLKNIVTETAGEPTSKFQFKRSISFPTLDRRVVNEFSTA